MSDRMAAICGSYDSIKGYRQMRGRDFSRFAHNRLSVIPSRKISLESRFDLLTGLYEKVINVKADVAAVLVSATKRREW
jgi:hypothetical protein